MDDAPALRTVDWYEIEPEEVEVMIGPERVAIYPQGEYLTWIPREKWESAVETHGDEWTTKAAFIGLMRNFTENPEDLLREALTDE